MLHLARLSCIGEALRDTVVTHKSNDALIEANRHRENVRYTYAALRSEAEAIGARLQAHGFEAGDRCAILMQNQSKWIIAAIGAFWSGAVLVPLDYKLTATEQLALIGHAKPKVLITEASTWRSLQEEADPDAFERMVVIVTEADDGEALGAAMRWGPGDQHFVPVDRARDDTACIVYSSGTGGAPKGCMLTHANYLEQAQVLGKLFPIEESDRYFSILPTNHAIDFMVGFVLPLLFGAAVVHQRTLRPQFLASTMKRYEITHMALVPTILKALERRLRDRLDELPEWQRRTVDGLMAVNEAVTRREPRHKLSRWLLKPIHDEFGGKLRLMFAGGAFVDRSSAEFFYKLGLPVVIGYGLTEAGTVLTVNDLKPFRAETVGKPIPGTELEIREPNEAGIGEVWVRGPTVMQGYLEEPGLTAEAIVDGWLRTGDLGQLDASGHLRLLGRATNMIVTEGGKNIYPEDIEAAFEDLPDCEEYCVFAANFMWPTGKMTGEQLVIVVRPDDDAPTDALVEELRARNRKLADFKRLAGYVVWTEEFPRTASLKIKRGVLGTELASSMTREQAIKEL